MTRYTLISLVLFLALSLSCGSKSDKKESDIPVQDTTNYDTIPFIASDYLENDLQMMSRSDSVLTIKRKDAHGYLGYLTNRLWDYRFIGMASTSYSYDDIEISVEISQFIDGENAYGWYALLRPNGTKTLELGYEGYRQGNSLYYVQNEFVVILSSFNNSKKAIEGMRLLAVNLSVRLGEVKAAMSELDYFPEEMRVNPSAKLYAKDYLSIKGLNSVYCMTFLLEEDSLVLFMAQDDGGSRFLALSTYAADIGQNLSRSNGLSFDENNAISFPHPTYGTLMAGLRDGWLLGAVGYQHDKHGAFVKRWVESYRRGEVDSSRSE